jgi:hypothetical protein
MRRATTLLKPGVQAVYKGLYGGSRCVRSIDYTPFPTRGLGVKRVSLEGSVVDFLCHSIGRKDAACIGEADDSVFKLRNINAVNGCAPLKNWTVLKVVPNLFGKRGSQCWRMNRNAELVVIEENVSKSNGVLLREVGIIRSKYQTKLLVLKGLRSEGVGDLRRITGDTDFRPPFEHLNGDALVISVSSDYLGVDACVACSPFKSFFPKLSVSCPCRMNRCNANLIAVLHPVELFKHCIGSIEYVLNVIEEKETNLGGDNLLLLVPVDECGTVKAVFKLLLKMQKVLADALGALRYAVGGFRSVTGLDCIEIRCKVRKELAADPVKLSGPHPLVFGHDRDSVTTGRGITQGGMQNGISRLSKQKDD